MDSTDQEYQIGGRYETEAQRLQREADEYTKKLEYERKKYLIGEDQYKQSQAEYNEMKKKIKEMIPSEEENHKKEVSRRHTLHVLANEKVRLNDTIGRNRHLKVEIDIMRKEIVFAKDSITKMERQITNLRNEIKELATESINNNKIANETNNQILALKAKHEEEKDRFELDLKKLQEILKERDEPIEFDDKSFNHHVNDAKGAPGQKQEVFANPIAIMKLRVNKLIAKNKEKKRLVDLYVKNAMIIEQAFEQIKDSSGIANIDEIVTTFIKAEEQNYSLFNYVNMLNQETDALEDNNRWLDSEIDKYRLLAEQNETEKQRKIKQLRDKADEIKNDIREATDACDGIQNEFNSIKDNVQKMVKMFIRARFQSNVANKQTYDEETQFNEQNIRNYLAELEEYISNLITMIAYKRDDPNAAISSVPLERLNKKEFDKRDLFIDAPLETEKGNFSGAATQEGDEPPANDDDAIIDPKALYKNFVDLVTG